MLKEARGLPSEVTGKQAVTLLTREVDDLFYFQELTLAVSRTSSFRKGITRSEATPKAKNDFHYQLKSVPYFGYLKQKKVISQWLLPAPDSLLASMWVNKVIIVDSAVIPVAECVGYWRSLAIKKAITRLYKKPSENIIPVLYHINKNGKMISPEDFIQNIVNIVETAPRLPLLRR